MVRRFGERGYVGREARAQQIYQILVSAAHNRQIITYKLLAKKRHGHCNVPRESEDGADLGLWISNIRHRKDRLSPERVRRMDALGFEWNPKNNQWNRMYVRLAGFKKRYGHCIVPRSFKDKGLAEWVNNQRARKDRLPSERIRQLDTLGLDWNPKDNQWNRMCMRPARFKKRYGHCNVPRGNKADSELASWVVSVRHRGVRLTPERIRQLDALGFDWNPMDGQWNEMFARLEAFKKRQGHCNVPRKWKHDRALGTWVANQRQHKNRLSPQRLQKLKALEFDWKISRAQKR